MSNQDLSISDQIIEVFGELPRAISIPAFAIGVPYAPELSVIILSRMSKISELEYVVVPLTNKFALIITSPVITPPVILYFKFAVLYAELAKMPIVLICAYAESSPPTGARYCMFLTLCGFWSLTPTFMAFRLLFTVTTMSLFAIITYLVS